MSFASLASSNAHSCGGRYATTGVAYQLHVLEGCAHGAWCYNGKGNCSCTGPSLGPGVGTQGYDDTMAFSTWVALGCFLFRRFVPGFSYLCMALRTCGVGREGGELHEIKLEASNITTLIRYEDLVFWHQDKIQSNPRTNWRCRSWPRRSRCRLCEIPGALSMPVFKKHVIAVGRFSALGGGGCWPWRALASSLASRGV